MNQTKEMIKEIWDNVESYAIQMASPETGQALIAKIIKKYNVDNNPDTFHQLLMMLNPFYIRAMCDKKQLELMDVEGQANKLNQIFYNTPTAEGINELPTDNGS